MTTDKKVIIGIIFLTFIIIAGGTWLSSKDAKKNNEKLSKAEMGEKMPDMGGTHVARGASHAEYGSNPPTSGPHWADVAGAGIKDEPVPDELMLHSMEHGAVVVWYQEGLSEGEVAKIKEAFQRADGKKIMAPRKDLDVPVVLASWGYLLKLNIIDENTIKEFIETNNDRAPEKAPV